MSDAPKWLKWLLFAVLFGGAAYVILPFVVSLATMALQLMVTLCAIAGLWLLLPALAEWLAQLAYVLWASAIGTNPTARLRRDLRAHADQIKDIEEGITSGSAQVTQIAELLRQQSAFLMSDERQAWQDQISDLRQAGTEMVALRDDELRKHAEFERKIQRLEANWKLGRAFKGALKSFSFTKKTGLESEGSKVAIERVQRELAESQARLRTVLSRKTVERQLQIPAPEPFVPLRAPGRSIQDDLMNDLPTQGAAASRRKELK